jgi:hypothetical protein
VISPPTTPTRRPIGQQRLQPSPFLVGQVMAIKHTQDLPHPPGLIHGTRPSPGEFERRRPRRASGALERPAAALAASVQPGPTAVSG